MSDSLLTPRVVHRFPIAMVQLRGQLTVSAMAAAHAALVEALTEEPTSLIVDISGLVDADAAALAVFPAVAELSAQWPGAPVLVCGGGVALDGALHRAGVAGQLSLHSACSEAIAVAAADPVPQRVHHFLEPTPQAPRAARELVAHACWEWDLPEAATSGQVLASELVTNAVRHARTTVSFSVTLSGSRLRLSVRDWDPAPVRLQNPTEADERGRGLLVVDTVAAAWGQVSLPEGKVVWAMLPVPASSTARPVGKSPPDS